MNDMALATEDTELDMYADDLTLTATGKTIETLDDKLNSDMESIVAWCDDNRMAVNMDKIMISDDFRWCSQVECGTANVKRLHGLLRTYLATYSLYPARRVELCRICLSLFVLIR